MNKKANETAAILPVMADPFDGIRLDVVALGKNEKDMAKLRVSYNDKVVAVRSWLIAGQLTTDHLASGDMKRRFMDAMAEGRLSAAELAAYRSDAKQSKDGKNAAGKAKHEAHKLVGRAFDTFTGRLRAFDDAVNADPEGKVVWGPTGAPVAASKAVASGGKRNIKPRPEVILGDLLKIVNSVGKDYGADVQTLQGHAELMARLKGVNDLLPQKLASTKFDLASK